MTTTSRDTLIATARQMFLDADMPICAGADAIDFGDGCLFKYLALYGTTNPKVKTSDIQRVLAQIAATN